MTRQERVEFLRSLSAEELRGCQWETQQRISRCHDSRQMARLETILDLILEERERRNGKAANLG